MDKSVWYCSVEPVIHNDTEKHELELNTSNNKLPMRSHTFAFHSIPPSYILSETNKAWLSLFVRNHIITFNKGKLIFSQQRDRERHTAFMRKLIWTMVLLIPRNCWRTRTTTMIMESSIGKRGWYHACVCVICRMCTEIWEHTHACTGIWEQIRWTERTSWEVF